MPRLSRRRVLELSGAAAALAALPVPKALAARPASFTQDLTAALPTGARAAASGKRTLAVVRAPRRFELIGLDFGRPGHVHADVRARRRGGRWSGWAPVHDATQPVWTGPADEFQVRFAGAARRLTARFVHTGGGAARARTARQVPATLPGSPPEIIPRSGWRAEKAPPKARPDYGEVQIGFVHHTVTANTYGPEDSASIVLGIARYHIDHNGWNDIGYNFLVDRYGQIFEGRAGGIDQPVYGAQAQGYNAYSTGVACLGDYTSATFSDEGVEAVAKLLGWKLPLHGAPVTGEVTVVSQGGEANRYRAGRKVTFQRIAGHRDGDATSCPGEALYAQLETIRRRAARLADEFAALTIRVEQPALPHPETVFAVAGQLRFADGTLPTGQPVELQFRTRGVPGWQPLASVAAGPDGAFATTVAAPANGRVRARYAGDGVHPPLTAAAVKIKLLPALTLRVTPKRFRARRHTTIRGTVTGGDATEVTLFIHRRVRGVHYKTTKQVVPIVDGRFRYRFTPPRRGLYRVTARAGGAQVQRLTRAVS